MKILRSLLLTAILAVSAAFTAFASPEAPTDQEVIQAFQEANTVYEWFEHHPLKTDGKGEKDTGYMIYYTVADKNYPNMMALKTRVNECFTEALAGFIISDSRMYREFDGKLYVAPSAKALDPPERDLHHQHRAGIPHPDQPGGIHPHHGRPGPRENQCGGNPENHLPLCEDPEGMAVLLF